MRTRVVTLLLVLLTSVAVFNGYGSGSRSAEPSSAPSTATATSKNVTAPGVLPIVKERVAITIAIMPNATVTNYDDNEWTKWIEQNTGIDIKFFFLPTTNPSQKIELMVASNQELPDIVTTNLSDVSANNLYTAGIILPLDDLIEKYGHYWKIMIKDWVTESEWSLMNAYSRAYDGKRIKFPMIYNDPTSRYSPTYTIWLRQDWLDAVGRKVPKTTDELYDVLREFRDGDPNKNGKKDEIPLICTPAPPAGTVSGANSGINPLICSFIYMAAGVTPAGSLGMYVNAKNGKLYCPAATKEYKDAMVYIRKLVSEGLLSTLSFTADAAQLKAMVNVPKGEKDYIGAFMAHPVSFVNTDEDRLEYAFAFPLKGPKGVSYGAYVPPVTGERTFITKYCKTPEVAVRLLDYFCEKETMLRGRWGVLGKDWFYADKGVKSRYGALEGVPAEAVWRMVNNPYASSNNLIWKELYITSIPLKLMGAMEPLESEKSATAAPEFTVKPHMLAKWGTQDPGAVASVMYTAEESQMIAEMKTSLFTYIMECQAHFANGSMSIEKDWQTYLKTLDNIGLQQFLKVTQAAYDRMKK
jgi:putative aldouronate transport system substrate-binding protein